MSDSTKRKRPEYIHARVTPEEKAAIAAKAKAVGGISALFRTAVLKAKPPKSKVDVQAFTQALAELGKVGSNVNQIAKHLNAGRPGDTALNSVDAAMKELREARHTLMRALGFEADRASKKEG